MKLLEARGALCIDQLPLSVDIEGFNVRAEKLMLDRDLFNSVGLFFIHKYLSLDKISNGAIFKCTGTSIALTWNTKSFVRWKSWIPFIIKNFEYAKNTRFLQHDIQYIKVEASHIDILNILTELRHHEQLDHKRSCKRRNKNYINKPLCEKTICEAKNESQCFLAVDNNGVNRHNKYYQKKF